MKVKKLSNFVGFNIAKPEDYIQTVDTDLINIFTALNGRLRFCSALTNGLNGENIEGEIRIFTSVATNGAQSVVAHTLHTPPSGFIVVNKGGFGDIRLVSATTANVTFATSVTSTSFTVFLIK